MMEEEKSESTSSGQLSDYDPEKTENPRCDSEFVPKCSENDSSAKLYSAQHHSVIDIGQSHGAHREHHRDNAMVQISLPTISRLSARVQNMQSAMGKFGDISLIALAQALASYALRLFFLDEFKKYYAQHSTSYSGWRWQQHQHQQGHHQYIELQIDMLTKASILCSVYVVFHSLILALTKRLSNGKLAASASVFEVIVPLVFGTVTIFLAIPVFIEWKKDPDLYDRFSYYYYRNDNRKTQDFLKATSIFLLICMRKLESPLLCSCFNPSRRPNKLLPSIQTCNELFGISNTSVLCISLWRWKLKDEWDWDEDNR
ncbi:hypothetical protein ACEPAH_7713 [Sanghuangporus vaninii]